MKNIKSIFAILILFSSCSLSDNYQNKRIEKFISDETITREDLNLKGNVRSFIEYEISPLDSFLTEGLLLKDNFDYRYLAADTLLKKIWADSIKDCSSVFFNIDGNALQKKDGIELRGKKIHKTLMCTHII